MSFRCTLRHIAELVRPTEDKQDTRAQLKCDSSAKRDTRKVLLLTGADMLSSEYRCGDTALHVPYTRRDCPYVRALRAADAVGAAE